MDGWTDSDSYESDGFEGIIIMYDYSRIFSTMVADYKTVYKWYTLYCNHHQQL